MVLILATVPLFTAVQPETTRVSPQLELARWADLIARRLDLTLIYDGAVLTGSVSIRGSDALTDDQLWAIFNQVLLSRGLATVAGPAARSYAIVRLAEAATVAGAPRAGEPVPGFATVVYTVRHTPAKELAELAARFASKGGVVTSVGDCALVISDSSARLEEIQRWLAAADRPASAPQVRAVPIQNVVPAAMATAAAQLAAKRDMISGTKTPGEVVPAPTGDSVFVIAPEEALPGWLALIAQLDLREPVLSRTYTPAHFLAADVARLLEDTIRGADDRWRVAVDDLTGSLVVTATATQHEQIRELMGRLESAPAAARRPVRSFVIRNRPVSEVQAVLRELLSAGFLDEAPDGAPGRGPKIQPRAEPLDPPSGGSVSGSGRSEPPSVLQLPPAAPDSIRKSGEPDEPAASSSAPLDKKRLRDASASIVVDEGTSTLIAAGDPRVLEQIEQLLKTLDVRQPQVMLEVMMVSLTESQTLDLGVELEQIQISNDVRIRLSSLFGLGTGPAAGSSTPSGSGFTGVVLSPGDFSILIRALQTVNRGRSLSMPKLLVANNQDAMLDSVLEQPYASINATNTVSTSSYGGSKPAGTQVSIKPQIAEGDSLILTYSVSLSSFTGAAASAAVPPPRQENRVQSVATIPDGYTVVVGGIELASDGKSVDQVPLLGSIPIVGEAFKNRSKNSSRTRFYVFIRAGILRDRGFEDLKYISDQDVARAGVDDGWPEVEPRVIK